MSEASQQRAVFAKVRSRIRREHAALEESEHEGGELNLVPYLDIVTNTVIFLLFTSASALALANINVAAPRYSDPATASIAPPDPTPKKEKLNLTVVISYKGFILGGAGGIIKHKVDGTLPTIRCLAPLVNERCPGYSQAAKDPKSLGGDTWVDKYDYKGLATMLAEIKEQYAHERQSILSADLQIPYQVVVRTMDTIRGKATPKCTGKDGCLFDQVILSAGVQ